MEIRTYRSEDRNHLAKLFYNTVHSVNLRDYNQAQLDAWAPRDMDMKRWKLSLLSHYTVVAEEKGEIVGFGDIAEDGYLDRLYVHKDHQREGIGSAIVDNLEQYARGMCITRITTDASLTALKFFVKRGYRILAEQSVERRGQYLTNFKMQYLCNS